MSFENFAEAQSFLLWSTFVIALIMGAVVNKTNFCTMGAVSDMVNMGDFGRMRAWLFAIAVGIIGMLLLEANGMVAPDDAFPPYRAGNLLLAENIIGGILFGIGMTLASGCGNKCLVRIGGGNIKSIIVFAIIGLIAFYMVSPLPGTSETLFSLLFYDWMRPMSVDLGASQDLGTLVAGKDNAMTGRWVVGGVLALVILWFVLKSAEFRSSLDNVLGGLVVGLAVLAGWYVSSNILVGDDYTLRAFVLEWDFLADEAAGVKPADSRPLSPQSFTFINPMGQTTGYIFSGFASNLLTFGIMAFGGVIAGSLLWSLVSRSFRIEWFNDTKDFVTHVIGAVLMGFGGVLAMGCTIGQGITGVSTLALGSIITFGAIVLGSGLTMKVQYYKMVYEDEATFFKALITGLVDFKLLPESLRKLEAI
jgi:uncharacterized membrane protein YedE/YeeE